MTLKQASWTHGPGIELESRSWAALRQGFYATVTPSNESQAGWVHFVIPSPVVINSVRSKFDSARIKFTTGPAAKITNVHVYDGEIKIAEFNGLNVTGKLETIAFQLPKDREVLWGTAISVGVHFAGTAFSNKNLNHTFL